jgi:RNA polymerase sigma-70 factor, ECF subfamily
MDELTDEQLVAQYRTAPASPVGKAALNSLFHRNHTRVAAWCYRFTSDIDIASDLAQEVFLKAFQRIDSFRGDSKFTTWIYIIARNHCMDHLRSVTVSAEYDVKELRDTLPDPRIEDASDRVERRQAERLVRKLMREALDDTESRVMTLHYVEEMPLEAVTRVLALGNQSGAKAYIVSARRKLSKAVSAWKSERTGGNGNAR